MLNRLRNLQYPFFNAAVEHFAQFGFEEMSRQTFSRQPMIWSERARAWFRCEVWFRCDVGFSTREYADDTLSNMHSNAINTLTEVLATMSTESTLGHNLNMLQLIPHRLLARNKMVLRGLLQPDSNLRGTNRHLRDLLPTLAIPPATTAVPQLLVFPEASLRTPPPPSDADTV